MVNSNDKLIPKDHIIYGEKHFFQRFSICWLSPNAYSISSQFHTSHTLIAPNQNPFECEHVPIIHIYVLGSSMDDVCMSYSIFPFSSIQHFNRTRNFECICGYGRSQFASHCWSLQVYCEIGRKCSFRSIAIYPNLLCCLLESPKKEDVALSYMCWTEGNLQSVCSWHWHHTWLDLSGFTFSIC